MANINTYALSQFKGILGITGSEDDSEYLRFIIQAVMDVDRDVGIGMTVTVSGSEYTLDPDPGETSSLWNVIAWRAVVLQRTKEYRDYLDQMEGLDTIRDQVASMSRGAVVKAKKDLLDDALLEYDAA